MIKRILVFVFCFSCVFCNGQFPNTQLFSNGKTMVRTQGGMAIDSTFVLPVFDDTGAANRGSFVKAYKGAMIRTRNPLNAIFMRDSLAAKWLGPLVFEPITASNGLTKTGSDIALGGALTGNTSVTYGPSGASSLSFINNLGSLSANSVGANGTVTLLLDHSVSPPQHRVSVQNTGGSQSFTQTTTKDSLLLSANGTLISSFGRNGNIRLGAAGVSQIIDTSANKPVTIDATGNIRKGYWFGGGASYWADRGSNRISNTNTSFVGIGNTTPAYTLDVLGDVNFTGSVYNTGSKWLHSSGVSNNIFLGNLAGQSNTAGSRTIGIGFEAFKNANNANFNSSIAIGDGAMKDAAYTSGDAPTNTVAIGTSALANVRSGFSNIAVGKLSLSNFTAGTGNAIIGASTGIGSGTFNSGVGSDAFASGYSDGRFFSGSNNSYIGGFSMFSKKTGDYNTALGYSTMYSDTAGDYNIAIGAFAGKDNVGGNGYNMFIGRNTYRLTAQSNTFALDNDWQDVNNLLLSGDSHDKKLAVNKTVAQMKASSINLQVGGTISVDNLPFIASAADTVVTRNSTTGQLERRLVSGGGGGVTTVGSFSTSGQTNGATISGSTITFGPATRTIPGMVSTGDQLWTGNKSTSGRLIANDGGTAVTIGDYPGLGATYGGVWITSGIVSGTNYSFLGTAGQTFFNAENTGIADMEFRIGNSTKFTVGNNGIAVGLSANTAPTHPFQVNSGLVLNASNQLGVGTTSPNASAQVDITSTTKGFLLPRLTTAQINAIVSPATGLLVFNTDINHVCLFIGTWRRLTDAAM